MTISAQKGIKDQNNIWIVYTGFHKLTDSWALHTEYQWRRSDWIQNWQQSLIRLGMIYEMTSKFQGSAGYAWIKTWPYGAYPIANTNNEHRIWQQLQYEKQWGKIQIIHRYRLEQRLIERWQLVDGVNSELDGFDFRQRVRFRLLLNIPLSPQGIVDNRPFLSFWEEVFLGFGKGIGKNVLDQNRMAFNLAWKFNKNLNVQLGYINQYLIKTDGVNIERNHTLQLGLFYNLDLSKKAEEDK